MFDKYSQMHVLTEFVLIEILSVLAESHKVPYCPNNIMVERDCHGHQKRMSGKETGVIQRTT